MFLLRLEQLEVVVISLVLVIVLIVLLIILIVVLTVSAVLVVLRIVTVVKSVIVVIVIRHFEFLLSIDSYRSSMSKTHKKNTHLFSVLWYYFQLHFCDFSTKIKL